jgi:hypothetical protein
MRGSHQRRRSGPDLPLPALSSTPAWRTFSEPGNIPAKTEDAIMKESNELITARRRLRHALDNNITFLLLTDLSLDWKSDHCAYAQ